MSPNLTKLLAVVLLFALWAALVFVGKADPTALVSAIGAVIAGLGVHGATAKGGTVAATEPPNPGTAAAVAPPSDAATLSRAPK